MGNNQPKPNQEERKCVYDGDYECNHFYQPKPTEEWEKEFRKLIAEHNVNREIDVLNMIDTTTMKKIMKFISNLLQKERKRVIEEVEKLFNQATKSDAEHKYVFVSINEWETFKNSLKKE